MNFLGIGSLEFLLIIAIGLAVVGPKRLLGGLRELKRMYTDFKRYRDELSTMVTDAIEVEELKKDIEPLTEGAKEIQKALSLSPEDILPKEVLEEEEARRKGGGSNG